MEARQELDQAVAGRSVHPGTLRKRARLRLAGGDVEGAVTDYTRSLEVRAGHAPTHLQRGLARLRLAQDRKKSTDARAALSDALSDFDKAVELAPDHAAGYYHRSRAHMKLEHPEQALQDLTRSLELNPRDPRPLRARARLWMTRESPDEALKDLDRAAELAPGDPRVFRDRSDLHRLREQYPAALDDAERALKLRTDDARLHRRRAELLHQTGRHAEAAEGFTRAIELRPQDARCYWGRAMARTGSGDASEASKDFERAALLNPKFAEVFYSGTSPDLALPDPTAAVPPPALNRGVYFYHQGDYASAVESLDEAVRLQPDSSRCRYLHGLALMRLWEEGSMTYSALAERADQALSAAIDCHPHSSTFYNTRGLLRFRTGRLQEAVVDFDDALERDPDDLTALTNRGRAHLARHDLVRAVSDFEKVLERRPGSPAALCGRGNARLERWKEQGRPANSPDWTAALQNFEAAVTLNSNYAEAYRNRGQARLLAGETVPGLTDLYKAAELRPDSWEMHEPVVQFHFSKKNYPAAIEQLSRAIVSNSMMTEAYVRRGLARLALQDLPAAVQDWEAAIRIQPSLRDTLKPHLDKARSRPASGERKAVPPRSDSAV